MNISTPFSGFTWLLLLVEFSSCAAFERVYQEDEIKVALFRVAIITVITIAILALCGKKNGSLK